MTEITSTIEPCLMHYKDGELVAITHSNGHNKMLKVEEMEKKDYEDFFEVNKFKQSV